MNVLYGPFINTLERIMKQLIAILAATLLAVVVTGCKNNPAAFLELPGGPEYVGEYLEPGDVRHIGHALNTAPTRMPVKWENTETGYQFSLMVFSSDAAMGTATRKFTVLTIEPSGEAEILNLVGTSTKKNVWHIVAETPAAYVGKAARMELAETPIPDATLSSNQRFTGFIVAN